MAVPSFLLQLKNFRCPEALCEGRHFAWGKVWLGGGGWLRVRRFLWLGVFFGASRKMIKNGGWVGIAGL